MIDEKQMMIGCIERLNESVKRLQTALEASRKNEQTAREERDAALVKISKVAEFVGLLDKIPDEILRHGTGVVPPETLNAFNRIKEILGVCSLCGASGRLGDAPCTHLG